MINRLARGMKLVVASHNKGKVWEIKQLISPFGLDAVSAGELDLPEPEETETTFAGNARLKAVAAAQASGLPALADDSGLEVDILDGAPGIYSARWAGSAKDFSVAMGRVADEIDQRGGWSSAEGAKANFICVLCLAWPDGETREFAGRVDGQLVWPARGGNGFGFDPMFVPKGDERTFGEMAPDEKHAISHRTRAFEAFKANCLAGLQRVTETETAGTQSASAAFEALNAAAANVSTNAETAAFVGNLISDLKNNGGAWERPDLERFLQAMQEWLKCSDGREEPAARMIAKMLLAARGQK